MIEAQINQPTSVLLKNTFSFVRKQGDASACLENVQALYLKGAAEKPAIATYLEKLGRYAPIRTQLATQIAEDLQAMQTSSDSPTEEQNMDSPRVRLGVNMGLIRSVFKFDQDDRTSFGLLLRDLETTGYQEIPAGSPVTTRATEPIQPAEEEPLEPPVRDLEFVRVGQIGNYCYGFRVIDTKGEWIVDEGGQSYQIDNGTSMVISAEDNNRLNELIAKEGLTGATRLIEQLRRKYANIDNLNFELPQHSDWEATVVPILGSFTQEPSHTTDHEFPWLKLLANPEKRKEIAAIISEIRALANPLFNEGNYKLLETYNYDESALDTDEYKILLLQRQLSQALNLGPDESLQTLEALAQEGEIQHVDLYEFVVGNRGRRTLKEALALLKEMHSSAPTHLQSELATYIDSVLADKESANSFDYHQLKDEAAHAPSNFTKYYRETIQNPYDTKLVDFRELIINGENEPLEYIVQGFIARNRADINWKRFHNESNRALSRYEQQLARQANIFIEYQETPGDAILKRMIDKASARVARAIASKEETLQTPTTWEEFLALAQMRKDLTPKKDDPAVAEKEATRQKIIELFKPIVTTHPEWFKEWGKIQNDLEIERQKKAEPIVPGREVITLGQETIGTSPEGLLTIINQRLKDSSLSEISLQTTPQAILDYLTHIELPSGAKLQNPIGRIDGPILSITGAISTKAGGAEFGVTYTQDPNGKLVVVGKPAIKVALGLKMALVAQGINIEDTIRHLDQMATEQLDKRIDQSWEITGLRITEGMLAFDLKKKSS